MSRRLLTIIVAGFAAFGAIFLANVPAYAAATPDSCFDFSDGTVLRYYQYENDVESNPPCPVDVEIPSSINGVTVTEIGDDFAYPPYRTHLLKSVVIPDSVTTIRPRAFDGQALSEIVIPDNVSTIGQYAFHDNPIASVKIGHSVESIGDGAFSAGAWDVKSRESTTLIIPSSVKTIGSRAFSYIGLTSVTLPEGLQTIGHDAFLGNNLTDITVPKTLERITADNHASLFPGNSVFGAQNAEAVSYIENNIRLLDNNGAILEQDAPHATEYIEKLWYLRVHLADPSNPRGFTDNPSFGRYIDDDFATVGHYQFGGDLIDTSTAAVSYKNTSGAELQPTVTQAGRREDGTPLTDYLVKNGPAVPAPVDPLKPTSAETTAIQAALKAYYRTGNSYSFTAPTIAGYSTITPSSPFSVTLRAGTNTIDFVYSNANPSADNGETANPSALAATGTNGAVVAGVGAGLVLVAGLLRRRVAR